MSLNRMQVRQEEKLSYVPWLPNLKTTMSPGKAKELKDTRLKKRVYIEESLSELKGTNQTQDTSTSACCIIAEHAMEIRVQSREKTAELFRPGVRKS